MAQIKYNLGNVKNGDNYSTNETVIGTWIDGKPLYRKVFKNIAVPSGSSWTPMIDLSDLSPEHLSINLNSDFYITTDTANVMPVINAQTYFSTALNGNKGVLTKLLRSQTYKKYESDFDLMEDTQVEMDQAIEMCSISRSVLNSMMDAFGSIINNNVNAIMKTLAVVTIVLSIPTLVASVYGMNFSYLPLSNDPNGFWIMLSVSFVVAILAAVLIILYTRRNKGD